jgi:hypothetical protein
MIRWVLLGSVLCFLMAASPADLFAQFNGNGNRFNPFAWGPDPRVRRAQREQAVAIVGPSGRDFVETQGDEAVAAVFACSRAVAMKLVQFHASGELGKLPRPGDLLRVIAQPRHRDDVALWAIRHTVELADTDSFDAYLASPLEYALGLKQIAAGAADARARRLNQATMPVPLSLDEKQAIIAGVGFLLLIGLFLWRRRHRRFVG